MMLAHKDQRLIDRLRVAAVPEWRVPLGWMMISLGLLLIALHAFVALAIGVKSLVYSARFMTGLVAVITGQFQLQEVRYQRIIRALLYEPPAKGESVTRASSTLAPG